MPIAYVAWYTRREIQNNPQWLYVFGDNLQGHGYGGQAKEARDEPNAVGIPTKRAPHMGPNAYLSDDDYKQWIGVTRLLFARLEAHLARGGTVIWPLHGIGTGLAKLNQKAPRIAKHLADWLDHMSAKHRARA